MSKHKIGPVWQDREVLFDLPFSAHTGSRLYRDLKLRSAIIQNKQLKMLPIEKISIFEHGVWNLSSESGNLGRLVASNVRVVWYADINEAFNISMPYITIGLEMNWGTEASKSISDEIEELEEIGEPRGEMGPHLYLASQLAQNKDDSMIHPVYSPYLGLAIEPLKEGFTIKNLFEVQTT